MTQQLLDFETKLYKSVRAIKKGGAAQKTAIAGIVASYAGLEAAAKNVDALSIYEGFGEKVAALNAATADMALGAYLDVVNAVEKYHNAADLLINGEVRGGGKAMAEVAMRVTQSALS